jgi:hypothetical protein
MTVSDAFRSADADQLAGPGFFAPGGVRQVVVEPEETIAPKTTP